MMLVFSSIAKDITELFIFSIGSSKVKELLLIIATYKNDTMKTDLHKTIKELSEIYDEDSQDTFITIYINKNSGLKHLKKRENTCYSLLKGKEQKNFKKTMEEIKEFLKKTQEDNIAIFASHKNNFFEHVLLSVELNTLLIVDTSPYIRPLARIQDEWESFTLVLINSNYAKIFSVSLGKVDHKKTLSKDIMNKHKKGGWSQARFQRLRKGAIHAFFLEVKEALEKIADQQIILAGPGPEKIQFRDMLPNHFKEKIIEVIDVDINDEQKLLKQSLYSVFQKEEEKSHEAVRHLKEEILKEGLAVYGLDDTLNAVKNGQVELLIIEKDYKLKGYICEHCQIVKPGYVKKCPVCGRPTSEADVFEEILEFAERTDAQIEFTDDPEISDLGHIGAILRYK